MLEMLPVELYDLLLSVTMEKGDPRRAFLAEPLKLTFNPFPGLLWGFGLAEDKKGAAELPRLPLRKVQTKRQSIPISDTLP